MSGMQITLCRDPRNNTWRFKAYAARCFDCRMADGTLCRAVHAAWNLLPDTMKQAEYDTDGENHIYVNHHVVEACVPAGVGFALMRQAFHDWQHDIQRWLEWEGFVKDDITFSDGSIRTSFYFSVSADRDG